MAAVSPRRRIESPRNALLKELARLRERRERDRSGRMLVEGAREAGRALEAGAEGAYLLVAPELVRQSVSADALAARAEAAGAEVLELSAEAFARLSLREGPDGVLLVARQRHLELEQVALPSSPLVLVADGLEKPGNLGALLRTADAVGVDAVFVSGEGTDLANPNVIRASMGSVFALPIAAASPGRIVAHLRAAGVRVVATTPAAERPHWGISYLGPVAIVVGSEAEGLGAEWLRAADERVRIPMRGRVADSLNVGVAGAIVLFEALRQRSG